MKGKCLLPLLLMVTADRVAALPQQLPDVLPTQLPDVLPDGLPDVSAFKNLELGC